MRFVPSVLRVPAFRRVWLAGLASNAGSWLQIVAAGWLVLDMTGSPAAVGTLALLARAPAILLSGHAGALADRFDRRTVGIWTFVLQGVAALALAIVAWAGAASLAIVFVLTFAVGVGFALGLPAMLALIPSLVAPGRLSQAVSLNAAGINVARAVGPAIGGVTLATLGAGACFAVNAVSFLALVAALLRLPPRPPQGRSPSAPVLRAVRHAAGDPAARRLLMGVAIFAALAAPAQELAPAVAANLGAGPRGLGILLGAMGAGALFGAWLFERLTGAGLPRHRALPVASALVALGIGGLALAPGLVLAVVAMAFLGCFWIWMFAGTNTAIQLTSPRGLLGRMLGLYQLAVIGPIALGSVAVGGLAEALGIRWALGAAAIGLGAWGLWSLLNPVPAIDRDRRPQREPAVDEGAARVPG
jgi:predicted MFS family arabinose efflux permease